MSGLVGVVAIAAGGGHNLALQGDGTVWAWGDNEYGQLGDGTETRQATPVQVSELSGVVAVAAGGTYSLALKSDGTVWQWGDIDHKNRNCTWGYATPTPQLTPIQVTGLSGVVAVSAARVVVDAASYCDHSLALKSDGTVWAWGSNLWGELGDGTKTDRSTPVPVNGLEEFVRVAAGGGLHSLAVRGDGTLWTWGANYATQLGDGTTTAALAPARVRGLAGVVMASGGSEHNLALLHDGTVWVWGTNFWGQLGYESAIYRPTPVQVVPPGSPDLALSTIHDGDFTTGQQGVYTLTVTNIGLAPTNGAIMLTETLPPGLSFISATGAGWSCSAGHREVTCTNSGPVNPGVSSTVSLTVDVGSEAFPGVMSRATVTNQSDLNASNNSVFDATVVLPNPR